jgi:uncharacterized protein (TIGR02270 family)
LVAHDHTLSQIARGVERRLLAHVDGLVAAGPAILEEFVAAGAEDGAAFALALALLDSPEAKVDSVEPLLRDKNTSGPATRALGLCHRPAIDESLARWLRADDRSLVCAALRTYSMREPPADLSLRKFLQIDDPEIQEAALRCGRASPQMVRDDLEHLVESPSARVRDAALEVALAAQSRRAYNAAVRFVERGDASVRKSLEVLAISGEEADVDRIASRLKDPANRAHALWALGVSGWPRAAEICLSQLEDKGFARLAGEAFSSITGLELKGMFALGEKERAEPPPLDEDDLDADLVPGAEDTLPLPEPANVAAWWRNEGSRLNPAVRYFRGEPQTPKALIDQLRAATMRRRPVLAFELWVRSRSEVWIDTSRWAGDQLRQIESMSFSPSGSFGAPFSRSLQG